MDNSRRRLTIVLALGIAAFLILPWYRIDDGFFGLGWLDGFPADRSSAPAIFQLFSHGRWWLGIVALLMLAGMGVRYVHDPQRRGTLLAWIGGVGVFFLALQGLAIGFE